MRLSVYLPLIACVLIASSGCASPAPAPTATPQPVKPGAPTARSAKPSATPPASVQPTATAGPGQEVDVTVKDTSLTSSLNTFRVGTPYLFVIKNGGTRPHCFDITQPVMVTGNLATSLDTALLDVPTSRLPVGATVKVNFTFPDSAVGNGLEFACLTRHDYYSNVRMWITVTK